MWVVSVLVMLLNEILVTNCRSYCDVDCAGNGTGI